jgi:hypothetical protein
MSWVFHGILKYSFRVRMTQGLDVKLVVSLREHKEDRATAVAKLKTSYCLLRQNMRNECWDATSGIPSGYMWDRRGCVMPLGPTIAEFIKIQ